MAKIQGSVPVAGFIAPTDSDDVFPVTDPKYQKGGYRVVSNVDEMNSITDARREEGMLVHVLLDNTQTPPKASTYRLKNGTFVKEELELDNYPTKTELSNIKSELENKITVNKEETDLELTNQSDRITALEEGKGLSLDEEMLELDAQGRITVKPPTSTTKGVVKIDNDTVWLEDQVLKTKKYTGDGAGIEVMDNGTIKFTQDFNDLIAELQNAINGNYQPPTDIGVATPYKIGLVKPDNSTILIDKNGTISSALTVDFATAAKAGIVKPDDVTVQVSSTGTISLKNPILKLEQIPNVNAGNITSKVGQYLRVADDGKTWELSRLGEARNRSFEFDIDSETDWQEVYDLRKHYNVAIAAQLECKAKLNHNLDLKFVATSGSEVIEHVNPSLQMYIPNREFHVTIFAKGKGKILLDILLVF
jgi:hypothetical protein